MQGFLKYLSPAFGKDNISDCAKHLKELKRERKTYPPELLQDTAMFINLKA
jgi:hypothetical protein